jgi:hypothetical protein
MSAGFTEALVLSVVSGLLVELGHDLFLRLVRRAPRPGLVRRPGAAGPASAGRRCDEPERGRVS